MFENENAVCILSNKPDFFINHTKQDLKSRELLINRLYVFLENTIKVGYRHFILTLDKGLDLTVAQILLSLKKVYKNLVLEVVLSVEKKKIECTGEELQLYKKVLTKANLSILYKHNISKELDAKEIYKLKNCTKAIVICEEEDKSMHVKFNLASKFKCIINWLNSGLYSYK